MTLGRGSGRSNTLPYADLLPHNSAPRRNTTRTTPHPKSPPTPPHTPEEKRRPEGPGRRITLRYADPLPYATRGAPDRVVAAGALSSLAEGLVAQDHPSLGNRQPVGVQCAEVVRVRIVAGPERPEGGHPSLVVERERRHRLPATGNLRADSFTHTEEHMLTA